MPDGYFIYRRAHLIRAPLKVSEEHTDNKQYSPVIAVSKAILLTAVSLSAQTPNFIEQWNAATSAKYLLLSPGQNRAVPDVADTAAVDKKVLQLKVAANATPGAGLGPEVESKALYLYGTYAARLKSVDIGGQADAGVVTGFYTYFNNGTDLNGDGLPDNSEIDFEWLGAEPQTIYLTMWTDYRDSDEKHKRVARKINLRSGAIGYCWYAEDFSGKHTDLAGPENQPETVPPIAGYNSAAAYYEYGIVWTPARVTWWVVRPDNGEKIVLWDYQGPPSRIPSRPSHLNINAWHTDNWAPESRQGALKPPSSPVSAFVDWSRYDTLSSVPVRCGGPHSTSGSFFRSPAARSIVFDCKGRVISSRSGLAVSAKLGHGRAVPLVR